MFRSVPAREQCYEFLKEMELGVFVTWKELSAVMEVEDARKSHRQSVTWAKERLAETHGKTLGPPTPTGFFMVSLSMQQERMLGPGECPECTMSGLSSRVACPHQER